LASRHRSVDLISDALPFGRPWYGEPDASSNAVGYVKFRSRSHDAVIRVYDDAGNVIENARTSGRFSRVVEGCAGRFHASATFTIAIVFKHSEHSTLRNPPLSYLVHVGECEWQFECM
jgi:hypothetical protein